MSDDPKALYLGTLRAEEAAGLRAIAFWEQQPPAPLGPGWVGLHLDGLKRQLEMTREAIRHAETENTRKPA